MLNVIALANNQQMDTTVNFVRLVRSKTQSTRRDVLLLQVVTLETKFKVLEMLKIATIAEHALFLLYQINQGQTATDQDQLAHAPRNIHLMDTAAAHALLD